MVDIVSIALSTSGIALRFIGDVTDRDECRFVLTLVAIAAGDASVLGSHGYGIYEYGHDVNDPYFSAADTQQQQAIFCWPLGSLDEWPIAVAEVIPRIRSPPQIDGINMYATTMDLFVLVPCLLVPGREHVHAAQSFYDTFPGLTKNSS